MQQNMIIVLLHSGPFHHNFDGEIPLVFVLVVGNLTSSVDMIPCMYMYMCIVSILVSKFNLSVGIVLVQFYCIGKSLL